MTSAEYFIMNATDICYYNGNLNCAILVANVVIQGE